MSPGDPSDRQFAPLPDLVLEPIVRTALQEDFGRAGDLTTAAVIPPGMAGTAAAVARARGIVAGTGPALMALRMVDPRLDCTLLRPDGAAVEPGDTILTVAGPAASILSAERVALNFLCHLSGIATETARLVEAARPHRAAITCTRKTTPGLRALEKAALRAGGGANHRFGLDDAILIKDNHIALAGGIRTAMERARAAAGHLVKIEIEVDTLDQLAEALACGPDVIMLDNMTPKTLRAAVAMTADRAILEASGGVRLDTVSAIAASGVDLISAGWLTHSAPALDIGLDTG
ncbi:carboxylating nicotinate-nucleotide diphosphorylase [Salipiger mucosus]|uniref:Probable nicotinate-nucleotide pyrophosphorylase [carboxylating] n=1 Tax=Salipiger mucosus DSM 16094 TaxID=1123237 RepID=S9RE27_9RHOB|nr:carboxylating nicotinate-nucleotide diphosphorylase [Salipiger mucosus]EPX76380.1 Quinolinate phosphoribosyltransferase (decarboxylating) [Salipiger mucosus DSM 16094]